MPPAAPHPAKQTLRLAVLGLILVILSGCQSLSSTSNLAQVRVIDLSPDAAAVDIYQGNNALAYNLSFGTVTSYVPLNPGNHNFTVNSAGTRQVLSSVKGSFNAATQYTVLINNPAASLQQLVIPDQIKPSLSGLPAVRFINQAVRTGAVDVYLVPAGQKLTSVNPLVTNLAFGANTGYLGISNGISTVIMLPAGTVPVDGAVTLHTGTQINYVNGSARSLILVDPQPFITPGLQVIATIDVDPVS